MLFFGKKVFYLLRNFSNHPGRDNERGRGGEAQELHPTFPLVAFSSVPRCPPVHGTIMTTAMTKFSTVAPKETIERVMAALKRNGIEPYFVASGAEAKRKVLELLPEGAEVMNMTSVTLETIGAPAEINESGKYNAVRQKLMSMDSEKEGREMRKLGAAPDYVLGSVHAMTEEGEVLIASNTGSQLPAYVYGAGNVIWVVGSQKLVKNLEEGMRRLYEYALPLESERAKKAYGVPGSSVNKILIVNREVQPGRITVIIVGEKLGF